MEIFSYKNPSMYHNNETIFLKLLTFISTPNVFYFTLLQIETVSFILKNIIKLIACKNMFNIIFLSLSLTFEILYNKMNQDLQ